jgi:hypothetical protein
LSGSSVSAAVGVAAAVAAVDAGAAAFAAALEVGRSVAWSVDSAVVVSKPIESFAVVYVEFGAAICFAEVSAWGLQPIYQMSWFAIVLVVWKLWFALVVFGV